MTDTNHGYYIGEEHNKNCLIPTSLLKEEVNDLFIILNYKLDIKLQKYKMLLDKQITQLENIIK